MISREVLKKEIDELPEPALIELQQLIDVLIKRAAKKKVPPEPMSLGGRFDDVDIRKLAYEE